jgi:Flp pilus assembly protein CpaB
MIIGVVVIALVLGGAFFLSRGGKSKGTTATAQSPVVVALQTIPQGTTLLAGEPLGQFFGVRQVPTTLVPFGSYSNVKQIDKLVQSVGCQPRRIAGCRGQLTVTQTIYQNLPVVSGMFSTLGQFRTAAGPAFQIPYGFVAIAVQFGESNSVLGSINPGDDVDLIASLTSLENKNGGPASTPTQTQYVLNDVRVIGVNGPPPAPTTSTSSTPSSSANNNSNPNNGQGGQLILLVRYQQALIIQHLKDFGGSWTMSVVLRSSKETDIPHFKTLPVFARWFFVKQENHFDAASPY